MKTQCKLALTVTLILLICRTSPAQAQNVSNDYFPKIVFGVTTGYFASFVENFKGNSTKEPLFGAQLGYELMNFGNTALYGVVRFNHFVAREEGRQLIKWQEDKLNFGLRYSIAHSFLGRPNAQTWLSGGVNRLDLSRKDFRTRTTYVWEGNMRRRVDIDESIIDTWDAQNFFVEIGQLIPFELSDTPNFSFGWTLKYDRGKDGSLNLGGLSFIFGFNFSAFYRS